MGYTAPVTRATSFVVGSTQWNELVNNDLWFATVRPMCLTKRASTFSVATGVPTAIPFDINHLDNSGIHSVAVNPTRLTAPVAGWYKVIANLRWSLFAGGDRMTSVFTGGIPASQSSTPGVASFQACEDGTAIVHLSAGAYVEVQGLQTAGGPLTVDVDSFAWLEWIATF